MIAILRIIRAPNLAVVALTQWLVASHIFGSTFLSLGMVPDLDFVHVVLLIGATVSICAAGYIINDLLDHAIDAINKPERLIVGKLLSESTVKWLGACFILLGFVLSLTLALLKDELAWLWLYPFFTVLLGYYPHWFKMRPFAGNLLVSGCCAGVAGLVWLAERASWSVLPNPQRTNIMLILLLFMAYAFLATWIREIIKDLEDNRGDSIIGRRTLPVHWGVQKTKHLAQFLSTGLLILLLSGPLFGDDLFRHLPVTAVSIALAVWVLLLMQYLQKSNTVAHYHTLSRHWKFFLLGGLLLLFLFQI